MSSLRRYFVAEWTALDSVFKALKEIHWLGAVDRVAISLSLEWVSSLSSSSSSLSSLSSSQMGSPSPSSSKISSSQDIIFCFFLFFWALMLSWPESSLSLSELKILYFLLSRDLFFHFLFCDMLSFLYHIFKMFKIFIFSTWSLRMKMNRCWSRLPHLTLRSHPPERYFDRSKNILDWDKKPCQRCQPVLVHSFSRFCTTSCMPSVILHVKHVIITFSLNKLWSCYTTLTLTALVFLWRFCARQQGSWFCWQSSESLRSGGGCSWFVYVALWVMDRGIYRVKLALQIWIPWCLCSGQHATFLREQKWFLLDAEYTPQGRTWRSSFCQGVELREEVRT